MRKVKHLISAVAVLLTVCLLPLAPFAADVAETKVALTVTAGEGHTGTVAVTSDYKATAVLPADGMVNTESVTAQLIMNNIQSLGIEGTRQFSATVVTGLGSRDVSLKDHIGNLYRFGSATVNATVDFTNKVAYTVAGSSNTLTASPDTEDAARAAWAALASHIEVTTQSADDSYAILANGSYIKVGTEYLHFDENYSGNLKLDNLSDRAALKQAIRDALVLETGVTPGQGNKVTILVKKGTALALGTTVATLKDDYMIEITAGSNVKEVITNAVLENLRGCSGGTAVMITGLALVNNLAKAIQDDGSIDVKLHPAIPADVKVALALNDSIAVNLYVTPLDGFDSSKFTVEYTFNSETSTTVTDISKQPIVVAECAAKEMGDIVNIKVSYDGAEPFCDIDYSVREYCEKYKDSSNTTLAALCNAALDYGAYAEDYFGYKGYDKTSKLLNGDGYPAGTLPDAVPVDYELIVDGNADLVKKNGLTAQLRLESRTEITFNVLPASDTATISVSLGETVLTEGYTSEKDASGVTHVTVSGIAAKELDKAYTLTVTDGSDTLSVSYSALTWAYSKQTDSVDGNLAKALYNYYLAAAAYLAS